MQNDIDLSDNTEAKRRLLTACESQKRLLTSEMTVEISVENIAQGEKVTYLERIVDLQSETIRLLREQLETCRQETTNSMI